MASAAIWPMDHLPGVSPSQGFMAYAQNLEDIALLSGSLDDISLNSFHEDFCFSVELPTDELPSPGEPPSVGHQRKRARDKTTARQPDEDTADLQLYSTSHSPESTDMAGPSDGRRGDTDVGRASSAPLASPVVERHSVSKTNSVRVSSRAQRERLRRERLNDSFVELAHVLEPGKSFKADKPSLIADAIKVIKRLRGENRDLAMTNMFLKERIDRIEEHMLQQHLDIGLIGEPPEQVL